MASHRHRHHRDRGDLGLDHPDDLGHPYWRRHYGMGNPWITGARGRRGCMVMLISVFVLLLLGLVVGVLVALAG
jgi:hypothetical protein